MTHIANNWYSVDRSGFLDALWQLFILFLVATVDGLLSLPHIIQHAFGSSHELGLSRIWLIEFLAIDGIVALILVDIDAYSGTLVETLRSYPCEILSVDIFGE